MTLQEIKFTEKLSKILKRYRLLYSWTARDMADKVGIKCQNNIHFFENPDKYRHKMQAYRLRQFVQAFCQTKEKEIEDDVKKDIIDLFFNDL